MITRISVFCKYLMICLLFFGSISLIAQTTNASKENKKHCQQKMKLFSDKIILTLNQLEHPIQSEIIIDPTHFNIRTIVQIPNKQDKKVTDFTIKEIKCEMNEDMTSGQIMYLVKNDNPKSKVTNSGFILKATQKGLTFSNTTDSPEDTAVASISKYEILE